MLSIPFRSFCLPSLRLFSAVVDPSFISNAVFVPEGKKGIYNPIPHKKRTVVFEITAIVMEVDCVLSRSCVGQPVVKCLSFMCGVDIIACSPCNLVKMILQFSPLIFNKRNAVSLGR